MKTGLLGGYGQLGIWRLFSKPQEQHDRPAPAWRDDLRTMLTEFDPRDPGI